MDGGGRCALLALAVLAGCGGTRAPVGEPSPLVGLLPEATALSGWTISKGPIELSPATLYEYLNGGADRYLTHGFRELVHVRYQLGGDPLASVTLDVFDMGSDLGAFGIYAAARTPGVDVRPWGAEGYSAATIAAAWKGTVYVHGEADDERPELIGMLERLVATACERAAGEASMPAILDPLPVDGRVAQSERYVPSGLLGHSFLPGGVLATYEIGGKHAELFYTDLGSEAAAEDALQGLRAHVSKWGELDGSEPTIGDDAFRYSEPTLGIGTVLRSGQRIAGIHGEVDAEAREAVLGELIAAFQCRRPCPD